MYINKENYNLPTERSLYATKEQQNELGRQVANDYNFHIGDYIVRKNSAGESYNKIIGFLAYWDEHSLELRIICDRAKRYNPSYSRSNNEMTYYHGEIWGLQEVLNWRDRGDLTEGEEAKKEFDSIWANASDIHSTCFIDDII